MRTTVAIDDDILAAAKELAARERRTIGEVLSMLARQGLRRTTTPGTHRNGVPLLRASLGAQPVSLELVNRLRDEDPS
jgi:hypothetical protein